MWPVLLLCPQVLSHPGLTHTHTKSCLGTSLGVQRLRHHASTVADMGRSLVEELRSPMTSAAKKWKKQKLKKKFIKNKKHVGVAAQRLEEHSASVWLRLLAEPPVRFR